MTFHSIRAKPAIGSTKNGLNKGRRSPRVAIQFDPTMFHRIAGEAERRGVPFAQVVRERVLEAYRSVEDGKARGHTEPPQSLPQATE